MNMMKNSLFALLIFASAVFAQDSLFLVTNFGDVENGYEFDFLRDAVTGEQWKQVWETEVRIPLVFQDSFSGGFRVDSLTYSPFGYTGFLTGKNRKQYKFRTLYGKLEIKPNQSDYQLFISDLTIDKKTSKFPYGVIISKYLLKHTGFNSEIPQLAALKLDNADSSKYPFLDTQAGFLTQHIPNKTNTLKTRDIITKGSDKHFHVNSAAYLKYRLMDVLLNSWEAKPMESHWEFSVPDSQLVPLSGNYFYAFSKFSGMLPVGFTNIAPQWNSFNNSLPPVESITWNNRFVDRKILSMLDKQKWQDATNELINRLTDKLLFDAAQQLPNEVFNIAGIEIFELLKSRRDELKSFSQEFYKYINEAPEIYGSSKDDTLFVERTGNTTKIKIVTEKEGAFTKTFDNNISDEIYTYLGSGNDEVFLNGNTTNGPILRVIGEQGEDSYTDSSRYSGNLLGFIPISVGRDKNYFYDDKSTSSLFPGISTVFVEKKPERPQFEYSVFPSSQKQRGFGFLISPILNYSRDDGIIWGLKPHLVKYDYLKEPFDYDIGVSGLFFTRRGGYQFRFEGIFNYLVPSAVVELYFEKSESVQSKYYGYGNNTLYTDENYNDGVYNLNQEVLEIDTRITFNISDILGIGGRAFYRYIDSNPNPVMMNNFPGNNIGLNGFKEAGFGFYGFLDTRDNEDFPLYGTRLFTHVDIYPVTLNNKNVFYKAGFEFDSYYTLKSFTTTTFNLKAGGKRLWYDYPFFEAVFLGGTETLPGYRSERFSGDAYLFSMLKANVYITELFYLLKAKTGLLLLGGAGRVFSKNDTSGILHESYGVGLFLNSFNDTIKFEIIVATTPETRSAYFNTNLGL